MEKKAELAKLAEDDGAADGGGGDGDGDVPRRKKGQRGSAMTPKGRRDLRSALGSMNPRRKGILRSSRTPLERSREPTRPKVTSEEKAKRGIQTHRVVSHDGG